MDNALLWWHRLFFATVKLCKPQNKAICKLACTNCSILWFIERSAQARSSEANSSVQSLTVAKKYSEESAQRLIPAYCANSEAHLRNQTKASNQRKLIPAYHANSNAHLHVPGKSAESAKADSSLPCKQRSVFACNQAKAPNQRKLIPAYHANSNAHLHVPGESEKST